MEKKPFLTEAMAQQIIEDVPTPFHVYDEKGIRENVRRINKASSWNKVLIAIQVQIPLLILQERALVVKHVFM